MRWLIYGNGWIGTQIKDYLDTQNEETIIGTSR